MTRTTFDVRDNARTATSGSSGTYLKFFARSLQRMLAVVTALMLFACSGGGNISPAVAPQLIKGNGSGATSASFTIQIPRATKAASASHIRRPLYVSASTQSIAIATNGQTPIVANLSPTSPGCIAATSTTPLTCTLTQPATIGADTFALTLYDGASGAGNVLSTATIKHTIVAGHSNTIGVTLNGVVSALQLSLSNPNPPIGTAAMIAVSVTALDADGNIIIAPGNYVNGSGAALPIVLGDSDSSGTTKLHGTKLSSPSSTASSLTYNGSALPSGATITASASGVSTVTALFAPRPPGASKLFVSNGVGLTTYNADGSPSTPTITGLYGALGLAVDGAGKIYITSCASDSCGAGNDIMTTYDANGVATSPIISTLNRPQAVAVDAARKIYIVDYCSNSNCLPGSGTVTTYNADGSASTPTINGLRYPKGVAVDATGKIYVVNQCGAQSCGLGTSTMLTFNADGSASTPTITGLNSATAVTLDTAGKIYIASNCGPQSCVNDAGSVATFNADGSPSVPTIAGLNYPSGIAVDVAGKIYVTAVSTVMTFNADGSPAAPTIYVPGGQPGIAVR